MSDPAAYVIPDTELPLHDSATAKLKGLADQYSGRLAAQARIVAGHAGAVQVSVFHVESAYHILRQSRASAREEAAKLASGATFGVGLTLLPVAMQAKPVDLGLTIAGVVACVIGAGLIGWIAGTQR